MFMSCHFPLQPRHVDGVLYVDFYGISTVNSGIALMMPVCNNFKTSFFTTSLIALLSLCWGSLEGGILGSLGMRWVQRAGLIPLRS